MRASYNLNGDRRFNLESSARIRHKNKRCSCPIPYNLLYISRFRTNIIALHLSKSILISPSNIRSSVSDFSEYSSSTFFIISFARISNAVYVRTASARPFSIRPPCTFCTISLAGVSKALCVKIASARVYPRRSSSELGM